MTTQCPGIPPFSPGDGLVGLLVVRSDEPRDIPTDRTAPPSNTPSLRPPTGLLPLDRRCSWAIAPNPLKHFATLKPVVGLDTMDDRNDMPPSGKDQ